MALQEENLASAIVEFCRYCRECGLSAGVKESVDALNVVRAVGVSDRDFLKSALRAVLCSSKDEWDQFDELFEAFWNRTEAEASPNPRRRAQTEHRAPQSAIATMIGRSDAGQTAEDDGGKAVLGATVQERLKRTDFSQTPQNDLAELERISMRLLKQMALRLSRRLKSMKQRGQVDLRRTIRRNISRGGDLIDLSYKARKIQQDRLVVLLDISGSMNAYSLFLLRFAFALQKHFKRVDTFLFSTQVTEITPALRGRRLGQALQSLAQQAAGWSGGTKIGESLRDFIGFYGRRVLSRDTVFIVLSDGWDTGRPEELAEQLYEIKRRVRRVIWLNPLLGLREYKPVTQGMSAALPYIDVFAPAHNLESLLALEKHLARN
ncbi:MAG TPA: VWA domain-containing protein [Candidatus Angelobacter sp.]